MTEYRGARGSNTGDDFHELWATRKAISLLSKEDNLEAIAVEGLAASDEAGTSEATWDGVDCTLYYGGSNAKEAKHVVLEQLKYSGVNPQGSWSISRLIGGKPRNKSVLAKLAKAWKHLSDSRPEGSPPGVALISNQKVDAEVISAFSRAAKTSLTIPKTKPRATAPAERRLAYAAGLSSTEFQSFSSSITFEGGAGSRFALEEKVLGAIAGWTDQDVQIVVTGLKTFVSKRMRPEFAGELIKRESVILHLGASDGAALFPCPSEIKRTEKAVSRGSSREATNSLLSGVQHLCLHGRAGIGKTTALQEIEDSLPPGSIMIKYDCYGGGSYLDPSAFRHRPADAFLQLSNDLSVRLNLPLLLSRYHGSDYPRLFANRLKHAAEALAAQNCDALIVIAIDAADNAVTAASNRVPIEPSFIHDFVLLNKQPENVRFVVTARTGRLDQLHLPSSYQPIVISPFSRAETGDNVAHVWPAPGTWIDDFHFLSNGVPRVQAYAFKVDGEHPSTALERLRPAGKSLDEVFRQQFSEALTKNGKSTEVTKFCAGLITLPRPVPLHDLAAVLNSNDALIAEICDDLAPGIRIQNDLISFADEDFEFFVRNEGSSALNDVQQASASWLLSRSTHDSYAALNVSAALVSAGRGTELLELVEREPAPIVVTDPVLRREAELQRLRLAIKVCREASDVTRALRFVLIGAEGIKTEAALRELLLENPDLAATFAQETAGRLILSNPNHIENHGPLLFHKLAVDATQGDAISVREGRRLLNAWLQARKHHYRSAGDNRHHSNWDISISDISSSVEAKLKLEGPDAALDALSSWSPKRIALEVAFQLPQRLIAEGDVCSVEATVATDKLGPFGKMFLLLPLLLAGRDVDINILTNGLGKLRRYRLKIESFFSGVHSGTSVHERVLDFTLTACEILSNQGTASELVDTLLDDFLLPKFRRIDQRHPHEAQKLDLLFRAFTLKEARAGRKPNSKEVFEPRPKPTDESKQSQSKHNYESHDRPLKELTEAVFGIYAAVADALINQKSAAELEAGLHNAVAVLGRDAWRMSHQHNSGALRMFVAKHILVLLAAGYDPHTLKKFSTDVHGRWRHGYSVPNDEFVARLNLRQELHASTIEDLAVAAEETRKMRIGADEKSKALVSYARLVKPISTPDANAIFNLSVEAASELDHEVMAQIPMLSKLIVRGSRDFKDSRKTARFVSDVIADAAIRLDGYDHFPWSESMAALVHLDPPLALANSSRWDDENIATLSETLPPILRTGLQNNSLSPSQCAALSLFNGNDHVTLAEVLKQGEKLGLSNIAALADEVAHDLLLRNNRNDEAYIFFKNNNFNGPWASALDRQNNFLSLQPSTTPHDQEHYPKSEKSENPMISYVWDSNALLDSSKLRVAITELQDQGRTKHSYLPISEILKSARDTVAPRNRVIHLSALAELGDLTITNEAVKSLLEAINEWWDSPAVKDWCSRNLPTVIVSRMPELTRYFIHGEDNLSLALERTGKPEAERQNIILRGIELHVDDFGSDLIFALAGKIGTWLAPSDAAELCNWYSERLAKRIPIEDKDQTIQDTALPKTTDEAVARFLFAFMGDYDLRMRWRAAHAVRRLARVNDTSTLNALLAEYERCEEVAFRGRGLAFYWLAARLWFVLTWDRIAGECPGIASLAGSTLLQIALDDKFPHLLVRSFAQDACNKLKEAESLTLSTEQCSSLKRVNKSIHPGPTSAKVTRGYFAHSDEGRRFKFDSMDTLPYWYQPLLRGFANVNGERFLEEVERWIIDIWGYSGDIRDYDKERRRGRFENRDWMLTDHRHGSKPTLERLNTHLEWHAMWCAAGELMKTESLVSNDDDDFDSWDELSARIKRNKLSEPPFWSADLLTGTPLIPKNWQPITSPIEEWVVAVEEVDQRAEMLPGDQPEYLIASSYSEHRMGDRVETTRISSALVAPGTGLSLLCALQSMDDPWDYKLPEEDEDCEIDQGPLQLLGWLQHSDRDGGLDEKDPLRDYASFICTYPGHRVIEACNLTRDAEHARWSNNTKSPSMFVFEAWGKEARDNERYTSDMNVAGHRLLVHKDQLQEFLQDQKLDLIIEVEVTRREQGSRQYAGEEDKKSPEGRFDRLYRLQHGGTLEVAEKCLGTWTGDR